MKSHRIDRGFISYLLDFKSKSNSTPRTTVNRDQTLDIRDSSSNLDEFLNYRSTTSNKHSKTLTVNTKYSNNNDLIINGSLFDRQLFQPIHSSYITDYEHTSEDLNLYLKGYNIASTCSPLDIHLFKLAFIITLSDGNIDKERLIDYCPQDDANVNILEEISYYKRFCFPELTCEQIEDSDQLLNDQSTYVFTRTFSDGKVEYGYCRRFIKFQDEILNFPFVFCIISNYSYFKLYDAILNELIRVYTSNEVECNLLMQSFYSKQLPSPTETLSGITCVLNEHRIFFYACHRDDRLHHDYFSTLLSCLSPKHIVHLFESLLCSKRILLYSRYPSRLTKSCLGLSFLIYPFIWPYSLVSLVPSSWLSDLIESPCPFIYGCLYETIEEIQLTFDQDTIQVDLDLDEIQDSTENTNVLPVEIRQTFESSLEYIIKYRLMKLNSNLVNITVSEACLQVFTELFYCLPDFSKDERKSTIENNKNFSVCLNYFKCDNIQSLPAANLQSTMKNREDKRSKNELDYDFQFDEFLSVQSTSYVPFLKKFINGMIFLKFLDDYQRHDNNNKQVFSLFSQRLTERRQTTSADLSISPSVRFRQTFDLLLKQMKHTAQPIDSSLSKYLKNIFE